MKQLKISNATLAELAGFHNISSEAMKAQLESIHSYIHNSSPFVLIELFYPTEGKSEQILNIAKESAKALENISGVIQTMVLKSQDESGLVSNLSVWNSEEDFNTFIKSDALKELYKSDAMKNIKEWTSRIEVKKLNCLQGWHQVPGFSIRENI